MPTAAPQADDSAHSAKRRRVNSDFPKFSLEDALRVAVALDRNAGRPMPPLETAMAMGLSPGSSLFRDLLSTSMKYGLTKGTQRATNIELLPAGESVNAPKSVEERAETLVAAALTPPKFAAIFDHYKNAKFPEKEFFANTIVRQFGIPKEHAETCAKVFRENMAFVGLLRDTSGGIWLAAAPESTPATATASAPALASVPDPLNSDELPAESEDPVSVLPDPPAAVPEPALNSRVFITHASNMKIVEQVKELLVYGKFEPIVAIEKPSTSKPVPDKVLDEMRACGAAVIHVEAEQLLHDDDGNERSVINPNVLIEIGAAMALYGRNFILLVERGIQLPSNLQGLYEVRYEGKGLDHEATMELLKAFNQFGS
jgi:hypothetical protein